MTRAWVAWTQSGFATIRGFRLLVFSAGLVFGCAMAQASPRVDPIVAKQEISEPGSGQPVSSDPVSDEIARDPEFGVTARYFGLQRQVLMYQWSRAGDGYSRSWSESWLDSAQFAPGHDNPAKLPLKSDRWIAGDIRIDGKPLDARVIAELGEWKSFRPNFSTLPANLAATFQPEGDGLGSAENPMDPQVGDLRIRWRELMLPSLAGRVVLQDGRWVLGPQAQGAQTISQESVGKGHGLLIGIGLLIVLLALAVIYRRHRHKPDNR